MRTHPDNKQSRKNIRHENKQCNERNKGLPQLILCKEPLNYSNSESEQKLPN